MGARKEGFKKRTVAGKDRGYRIVGAFVKSLSRINELIFYFVGSSNLENTMSFVVQSISSRTSG